MDTEIKYAALEAVDTYHLKEIVEMALANGWSLQGGVATAVWRSEDGELHFRLFQAVVKPQPAIAKPRAAETEEVSNWNEWEEGFMQGILSLESTGAPIRAVNAIKRAAGLVAKWKRGDTEDIEYINRIVNYWSPGLSYRGKLVTGFDEWVSCVLQRKIDLTDCHLVGKEYAKALYRELDRIYGAGVTNG